MATELARDSIPAGLRAFTWLASARCRPVAANPGLPGHGQPADSQKPRQDAVTIPADRLLIKIVRTEEKLVSIGTHLH